MVVDRPTPERLAEDLPGLHRATPEISILVADDERAITSFLAMGLGREGYRIVVASDGFEVLALASKERFDLAILDVMMPGLDGIEVCRRLRGDRNLLILLLTARDAVAERIEGLESGADDYLVKPFDFSELLAHVHALLRRRIPTERALLTAGPYAIDEEAMSVTRDKLPVQLTPREYDLFRLFLRHPRQVLTRDVILSQVWGPSFFGDGQVVDVYVRYLRMKLDPEREYIQAVRGLGYRLMA